MNCGANRNAAVQDLHRRRLQNTRCGVCSDFGRKCTATVSGAGTNDVNGNYVEANNMLDPTGGSCVMVKENCGGTGRVCGIRYSQGQWQITSSRSSNRVAYFFASQNADPASMSASDTWVKGSIGANNPPTVQVSCSSYTAPSSCDAAVAQSTNADVGTRCGYCQDFGYRCTVTVSGAGTSLWDGTYTEAQILVPSDGACMWEQNCNGAKCGLRYNAVEKQWQFVSSRSSNKVAYYLLSEKTKADELNTVASTLWQVGEIAVSPPPEVTWSCQAFTPPDECTADIDAGELLNIGLLPLLLALLGITMHHL